MTIRCIEVSPGGPIVQGDYVPHEIRNFQTGKMDQNGHGTIENCGFRYWGKPIEQKRRNIDHD